jgi:hypothetical protein
MEGRNLIPIESEDNMETIVATGTKDICTYISLLAIIVSTHKQSRYSRQVLSLTPQLVRGYT